MLNGHTPAHGTRSPKIVRRAPEAQEATADVRHFRDKLYPMTAEATKKGIARLVRRKEK